MPKSFGYLNEGNPLTIRDNEAQEMVNCAIERGWIEYKAYPVPTGLYDCVPNREVKLSDDYRTLLQIVPSNPNSYARSGYVRFKRKADNDYIRFGIKMPTGFLPTLSLVTPLLATGTAQTNGYYVVSKSTKNQIAENLTSIKMARVLRSYSGSLYGIDYDDSFIERSVVKSVKLNDNYLSPSDYTILQSGDGYPVINLANPTPAPREDHLTDNTIEIEWNYFLGDCPIFKEPQTVFYAFTFKENQQFINNVANENYNRESPVRLRSIYIDNPPGVGAYEVAISAAIPSGTGAVQPVMNIYRMPFGGSEYLFDVSYSSNISNQLDLKQDSELGVMLETEGNTNDYLDRSDVCCMTVHNDRLFLAEGSLLVFSKPSQYDQFPAENFYVFSDNVVDLCKYDSNLAVFTETKSYIIYGAGTDGFVIAEVDWKTKHHIRNCARSIYTKLISLTCEEDITIDGESYPTTRRNSILQYNHRYAQDISLRVKDSLAKGVLRNTLDSLVLDCVNRNTVIENRYYVAELRYYNSASATDNQVKTFNLVYDVIADGFCLYDPNVKDFSNQTVFKYRTKEFKMVTPPSHQAQYHKGIYVKGKGTFKVNVYADGELVTSLTHNETDNSKPLRIILHNMGNKRGSTISLEFIGTQGAQIHDWEVYD